MGTFLVIWCTGLTPGKGLLSKGGDKWARVLDTVAPLTSNQVQFIVYMQQFIDEATTLSKKCIYKLVFITRPSKARYEQGTSTCVEAAV